MKNLSLVMPYYENPRMFYRQMLIWRDEWPGSIKEHVDVIVVDDGSPIYPAASVERPFGGSGLPEISIYRVLDDRPWHQHGARNLGAHVATSPVLLMTDMDHVVPPDTITGCATMALVHEQAKLGAFVYTFGRRDAPVGEPWKADHVSTMAHTRRGDGSLKPHVNSFLIGRETYWRIGGYDEAYCGLYGTDGRFRKRLYSKVREIHLPHLSLIRVSRDVIPDASTVGLRRKEGRKPGEKRAVMMAKAAAGKADEIVTLNFQWRKET